MKSILFVINSMEIGGTRRSLLNLMDEIVKRPEIECDLLIFAPHGEYMSQIPKRVRIIKTSKPLVAMFSSVDTLKNQKDYRGLCLKTCLSVKKRFFGEFAVMSKIYRKHIENMDRHYDMVIGFQEGGCNDYASRVFADKKIFWIHNNYENLTELAHGDPHSYESADSINFVAEASMDSFKAAMPQYASKMRVIKNVLPQQQIRDTSVMPCEKVFSKKAIHLISVGRVAYQKGFDRLLEAANDLKTAGYDFEWIILGDGEQREDFVSQSKNLGIEKYVRFIGAVSNPYPYIKQADLFVLTSRYESQPMAIMEALTLGIPVLSTSFDSVKEIIQDKDFALEVENSVCGIRDGLKTLLDDKKRIEKMKKATSEFIYDNASIIDQLLNL